VLVLEDQVAAGQVCLALELVARPAEQSFFVVELERGLVPGAQRPPGSSCARRAQREGRRTSHRGAADGVRHW
jgi:hypothetical protein